MHVKSLNWGYKADCMKSGIKYFNAKASFINTHTLLIDNDRSQEQVTAKYIIIATGSQPNVPNIPGRELGITTNELFNLQHAPGKTLIIGASYVALETASFLTAFGYDTTVMARDKFLRGFD